jgi:hypothetical protein
MTSKNGNDNSKGNGNDNSWFWLEWFRSGSGFLCYAVCKSVNCFGRNDDYSGVGDRKGKSGVIRCTVNDNMGWMVGYDFAVVQRRV